MSGESPKRAAHPGIDFHSNTFCRDPYPSYRQLQALQAPYWLDHIQMDSHSRGLWMVGSYRDTMEIFKAASLSKQITRIRESGRASPMDFNLLNQDPPDHTRLRNMISAAFLPASIRNMETAIAAIAESLCQKVKHKGELDFIADIAEPLPVMVIAQLLGISPSDLDKCSRWSKHIMLGYDSVLATAQILALQREALQEAFAYFRWIAQQRRQQPQDDLVSMMLKAQADGTALNEDELIGMCTLLLVAGHETTTHLMGNGLLSLLRNPQQFELLRAQPEYLTSAVEEMLRYESPAQRSTFRVTTERCVIAGQTFAAGEQVCAVIGAANRDPEKFADPDRFDITRSPNPHLAFGIGPHFCIGAMLGRTEARLAFTALLQHFSFLDFTDREPQWNISTLFRGLKSLPLRFTAR